MGSAGTSQTGADTHLLCLSPLPAEERTRGQKEGLALTLPLGWAAPASRTGIPARTPMMASQQLRWREQKVGSRGSLNAVLMPKQSGVGALLAAWLREAQEPGEDPTGPHTTE